MAKPNGGHSRAVTRWRHAHDASIPLILKRPATPFGEGTISEWLLYPASPQGNLERYWKVAIFGRARKAWWSGSYRQVHCNGSDTRAGTRNNSCLKASIDDVTDTSLVAGYFQ
jgi:hypothetical protein